MDKSLHETASFVTQADALLRKNIAYQKQRVKANAGIILSPAILFILMAILQHLMQQLRSSVESITVCPCDDRGVAINASYLETCATGIPNIDPNLCQVRKPQKWPPLLQVPQPQFRAVGSPSLPFNDLPVSCSKNTQCPTTFLVTAANRSFSQGIMDNIFTTFDSFKYMDAVKTLMLKNAAPGINSSSTISDLALGTDNMDQRKDMFMEDGIIGDGSMYILQHKCSTNVSYIIPLRVANETLPQELECVEGLMLWRDSSRNITDEITQNYQGKIKFQPNAITAVYDLSNSGIDKHNVTVWYNSTPSKLISNAVLRVPRSVNLVSNAYLKSVKGSSAKIQFDFVKEMPQSVKTQFMKIDFGTLIGSLFFVFLMQLLLPVILNNIVYEKQQKLRILMKMHGLGDGPYWIISYAYFLVISVLYLMVFMIFGTLTKMTMFTMNSYTVQFMFYFMHLNWQISFAMLASTCFSTVKTASVVAYTYVFGSGLAGQFILNPMVESDTSRIKIMLVELVPGFSLFRGLSEFTKYSSSGYTAGGYGFRWVDLHDKTNGMETVLLIMAAEWLLFLVAACFLDQPAGDGGRRCLKVSKVKRSQKLGKTFSRMDKLNALIEMEGPDIAAERTLVEQLNNHPDSRYTVVCDSMVKVLKGRDGNPDKMAVKGLSLALPRGECFGMLGPTGAGKTTLLNMLTGFSTPSSGTAYIGGMDIRTDMNRIYYSMGVCPQHDLLWETLTSREHLLFYGRLKNLKGEQLNKAIEDTLLSVNLLSVIDKQAGQYSGGMKRRLSVAISLIGDPQVVYLDEPSTGLDPASRQYLWNAVMNAKRDRAIILTTHSMEEAEYLSDRLGIFVDGSLQCIGSSQELKAKYGGLYVLTITSPSNQDEEIENMVRQLFPKMKKTYHISGTQKFEMPKKGVKISSVFDLMERAKKKLDITAWGLADTTLEDVFIKVARRANASVL